MRGAGLLRIAYMVTRRVVPVEDLRFCCRFGVAFRFAGGNCFSAFTAWLFAGLCISPLGPGRCLSCQPSLLVGASAAVPRAWQLFSDRGAMLLHLPLPRQAPHPPAGLGHRCLSACLVWYADRQFVADSSASPSVLACPSCMASDREAGLLDPSAARALVGLTRVSPSVAPGTVSADSARATTSIGDSSACRRRWDVSL